MMGSARHQPEEAPARRAFRLLGASLALPSQRLAMLLPIMTTPITSRSTTMIATLFSTSHSRSLSNGPRIRVGATRWATTGTATVDVAIAVNTTMTTAARPLLNPSPTMRPAEEQVTGSSEPRRQQQAEHECLARHHRVNSRHPLRQLSPVATRRPLAPLSQRQHHKKHTDHHLDHRRLQ